VKFSVPIEALCVNDYVDMVNTSINHTACSISSPTFQTRPLHPILSINMSPHISDDDTSYLVEITHYDTNSLCSNYTLRRHKDESEANAGCQEARADWTKYIGPIKQYGGYNPINGNFTAVVLPLSRPERVRLIAYVLECE
jgi:hypothetical protein